MEQYKDLFYSFEIQELPQLNDIKNHLERLKTVPPSFSVDFFKDLSDNHSIQELRKTLYAAPDEKISLNEEARERMQKDLARLTQKDAERQNEFDKGWAIRKGYISWPANDNRHQLIQQRVQEVFNFNTECTGDFLYPLKGFRSWHTNKYDLTGWAMFIVLQSEEAESYFQFMDPETNELVRIKEKNFSFNFFSIRTDQPFWHSILVEKGLRWSIGFSLPSNWKELIEVK